MKKKIFSLALAIIMLLMLCACGGTDHTHVYGEWTETKAPNCTETGERTRTCECGAVETETIPTVATAHAFGEWTEALAPLCGTEGQSSRACIRCGATETAPIPATGKHDYDTDNTCKVCDTPWVYTTEGVRYSYTYKHDDDYNTTYYAYVSGIEEGVTDVVLPYYYNGYPLTTILYGAFQNSSLHDGIDLSHLLSSHSGVVGKVKTQMVRLYQ